MPTTLNLLVNCVCIGVQAINTIVKVIGSVFAVNVHVLENTVIDLIDSILYAVWILFDTADTDKRNKEVDIMTVMHLGVFCFTVLEDKL
jgi:hypothetical protein